MKGELENIADANDDTVVLIIRDADNCIIAGKSENILAAFKELESRSVFAKEKSVVSLNLSLTTD